MRRAVALLILTSALPAFAQRAVHVRSTVTKNGEYRQAHERTAPNNTQRDNYSAKGNVNPYTGKAGTRTPKK